jgi:hypothetical protein
MAKKNGTHGRNKKMHTTVEPRNRQGRNHIMHTTVEPGNRQGRNHIEDVGMD